MKLPMFGLLVLGLTVVGAQAHAATYGTAGCGIGALAFKDQPGKIQIVAATLNNIISPQTSAITSGTSGCTEGSSRDQASLYIRMNREALRNDIARGNGETIDGLAKILRCDSSAALATSLQSNFQSIFPNAAAPAEQVDASIESTIRASAVECGALG